LTGPISGDGPGLMHFDDPVNTLGVRVNLGMKVSDVCWVM